MIGNCSILTNYDNLVKPSTKLYIQLPFWFSLHNGNELPLVSLIYHDLEFYIEFNSLNKCCFYNGSINLSTSILLNGCSLYIDYVYLEDDERKKFAQYTHEYLISQVQLLQYKNLIINKYSINIDFVHPITQLFWIIKENKQMIKYKLNKYYSIYIYEINSIELSNINCIKVSFNNNNSSIIYFNVGTKIILKYSKYYDGIYDVIYTNYSYVIIKVKYIDIQYINYNDNFYGIIYNYENDKDFNPIDTQYLYLNNQYQTENVDSMYYNYVVPYKYYNITPYNGINVYSFSLFPTKLQPSGSCNFTMLKNKSINIILNNKYYNYLIENNYTYNVSIYAINYNILKIHNGLGFIIF
jgi:hypothetical protein